VTLSTPLLWVILPLMIAILCVVFINRHLFSTILSSLSALGLALLAAFFPENLLLAIGPFTLSFTENLGFLGRQITIRYEILPFITLLYAMTALWMLSSSMLSVPKMFPPIGLTITALLTAAIGVEPFLYAALLIETAVLVSVPLLFPMEEETHVGILRYLTLQTMAMPFILLAGWLLTGVETLPPDSPLVNQTTIVLGLGFALLLGVFPFHSWVPMISQHGHPFVVSFIAFILPTTVLFFGLNFIDRYTFLRASQSLFETLRIIGLLMIVLGGVWTAVQDDLKRAFGFSVLTETGFSLMAIGLTAEGGLSWLLVLLPVRALGFWLWAYTLTLIEKNTESLNINALHGLARRYPVLSFGLLLAQFSVAGLPLLAAFPIKISLLTAAFSVDSILGFWVFAGSLGLSFFTIRLLIYLVAPDPESLMLQWTRSEKAHEYLPVVVMSLILVLLGLFPNSFPANISSTLTAFTQLQ
jgi:NADH-quinone oxidoreductase subunit N